MRLEEFLDKKSLYYDKIDYDIIKFSWGIVKEHIKLPFIIHIIGTNGKGSTGRLLASFLNQNGKKVLHYSSPHILKFNERIWINGSDSSDLQLNKAHEELQNILPKKYLEKLTYFEYTTLLGLLLSSGMDYLVLEAGLGGEFDATNVVKNNLTILTAVGLDHQSFLGDTIKDITLTKVRSCDNTLIVTEQSNSEVYEILDNEFKDKIKIIRVDQQSIELPCSFAQDLPGFLRSNLKTVVYTLHYLQEDAEKDFILPKLNGRYEKITSNITLDVGHNPLAANALAGQLKKDNKKIVLIYNSFKDKDYNGVLAILKPYIEKVLIISCEDQRILEKEQLTNSLEKLGMAYSDFEVSKMDKQKDYLVFGSFSVAESFLKETGFEK
jgi:dihydrofolate synthase/folylpolyglutamate synthase